MPRCLSSLVEIAQEGYSPAAGRALAGGARKFPHRLSFNRKDVFQAQLKFAERMSISGVQDKISLKLIRGRLEPAQQDGDLILKPVPSTPIPFFQKDVPANEHLTMQLATQIFGIPTATNACIFFANGELAYITRRFDRRDGIKISQEDFCQLSNRTEDTGGKNYKYDASYQEVGRILKKFCSAYPVEIERLFRQIVFNYVFSNGDAHLKNFSLFESKQGDYLLTPAYDLLCTSLHFPNETRTALDLFDDYESEAFRQSGFYTRGDFLKLAEFYGMSSVRAERFLAKFSMCKAAVFSMIQRSFLSQKAKANYTSRFRDRLRTLR